MPRKELPHLINKNLSWESAAKAIQENFDALTGEVGHVDDLLVRLQDGGAVEEAAAETGRRAAHNVVLELEQKLAEAGVGQPDGEAPSQAPTNVRAVGGIGNWFVVFWDAIPNSSPVTYEVHVHTSAGFAEGANTLVGEYTVPGNAVQGSFIVRDFDTGHVLDGTGSDPVKAGVTYRVKVRPKDEDGVGPTSSEVTVSALTVDASSIIAAGTIVGNLIASQTVATGHLAAGAVTAAKIDVDNLEAISADLGNITAGSLNAVTVNGSTVIGGLIQSSGGASYIRLSSGTPTDLELVVNGFAVGKFGYSSTYNSPQLLHISSSEPNILLKNGSTEFKEAVLVTGAFWVGTDTQEPPTGAALIYKSGNALYGKAPGRAAVKIVDL